MILCEEGDIMMRKKKESCFSYQSIFKSRQLLSWGQIFLILILWSVLWLKPMAGVFQSQVDLNVQNEIGKVTGKMPEESLSYIAEQNILKAGFEEGQQTKVFQKDDFMLVFLPKADDVEDLLANQQSILLLLPESFIYQVDNNEKYAANYSVNVRESLKSKTTFANMLNESYQSELVNSQKTTFLLGRHLVLCLFGIGGLFIIGTVLKRLQDYYHFDIYNFKETMALITIASIIPNFLSFIIGMWHPNIALILSISLLGTIICLLSLYRQTKFKEVRE